MVYLSKGLICYVLIFNLEESFNFHLTFLQLNVIAMFTICSKNWVFFSLLLTIFFELPITRTPVNSNLFRFPLKVRVIGSRLYYPILKRKVELYLLMSTHRERESFLCRFLQMLSTATTIKVSVVYLQCSLPC